MILYWTSTYTRLLDIKKVAEAIVSVYTTYIDYIWNPSDILEFIESGQYEEYSDEILDELNIDHTIDSKIEELWESIDEKEFNNIIISLYDRQDDIIDDLNNKNI